METGYLPTRCCYAARHQFIPDLTWPEGVRIAVNFTCDFDAMLLRRLRG
jgi:peptidoglycan-N-acetylglucosamine deacetylase